MFKKWLFILFVLGLIFACQKQEIKQYPLVYDFGYFPLDSGMWKHYDVTLIVIDVPSEVYDTTHYQLREVFAGWYLNAANDSMMRIERFMRDSSHHSWQPISVWQSGIKSNDAFQIEENVKFLKIKFPVKFNNYWDGDAYNRLDTLKEYSYEITSLDVAENINTINFDSVLTVTQKDKYSIIDKVYYFEKYAYGIGLVEKEQIYIYSDVEDFDPTIPVEDRVTKGTLYYQKIIEYGKN